MLQIAVVEDDVAASDTIRTYLNTILAEKQMSANIHVYDTAEQLIACRDMRQYHMALFDIELPGINGMEAAKRFREANENAVIIFVTNMAQYALAGYEVSAMDFIVKPVNFYDFAMKIKRALKKVTQFEQDAITVLKKESINRIPIHDILYIEVMNHRVYYHLENEKIDVFGALKDVEDQIKNFHFARCNRCYLVNLSHVRKVQDDEVYINDERLSISRSQKKSFLEAFVHYLSL